MKPEPDDFIDFGNDENLIANDSSIHYWGILEYSCLFVPFFPLPPLTSLGIFLNLEALRHFELYQVFKYFLRYILTENVSKNFKLYQVSKCPNISILQILKTLLSKNRFYFFFLIFWHAKIPPSFRMPHYWNWFLTYAKQKFW